MALSLVLKHLGHGVASEEFFGYAQAVTAAGRYEGLKFGEVGATIYMDESSVLVHPDAARRQIEAESEQQTTVDPSGTGGEGSGVGEGGNGGADVSGPDSITVDVELRFRTRLSEGVLS